MIFASEKYTNALEKINNEKKALNGQWNDLKKDLNALKVSAQFHIICFICLIADTIPGQSRYCYPQ